MTIDRMPLKALLEKGPDDDLLPGDDRLRRQPHDGHGGRGHDRRRLRRAFPRQSLPAQRLPRAVLGDAHRDGGAGHPEAQGQLLPDLPGRRTRLPARPRRRPKTRPARPMPPPRRVLRQRPRRRRGSRPCVQRSSRAVTPAPIGCASRWWSRLFGQIKQARGFRQFLLRGIDRVRGEWALVCTTHNLLKLAQGRSLSAATPMPQKARLAAA